MKRCWDLLLTCEHGGNCIPERWQEFFAGAQAELDSHLGYDLGALPLARSLAKALHAPLIAGDTSRLLVDLNRSLHHRRLFSRWTANLPQEERQSIIDQIWQPHRRAVLAHVERHLAAGARICHIAVHSFTPLWRGQIRRTDVGLLYDPRRLPELRFAKAWQTHLEPSIAPLRVRRNDPYRGGADGLATALRKRFAAERYLGIELEINQRLLTDAGAKTRLLRRLQQTLVKALRQSSSLRIATV